MSKTKMRKRLHGILLRDLLIALDKKPSRKNMLKVKEGLKELLDIEHTEALTDQEYWQMMVDIQEVAASEYGVHIPLTEDEKTMQELLNETNQEFNKQNNG